MLPTRSASSGGPVIVISLPRTRIVAVERRLDQLQERVTLAEEGHHRLVTRDEDLHLGGGVRQVRLSRG